MPYRLPRRVDRHEGRLHLYSMSRPVPGDSRGSTRQQKIVRVEKDQYGITGERPSAVHCDDLTTIRSQEDGSDSVFVTCYYRLRSIGRAVIDDDHLAKRILLT
jgi:hypothetical protein